MKLNLIDGCCGSVAAGPLAETDAEDLAAAFKVLSDPVRLRMLSFVASAETGEVCACDLVEPSGRSQPTVSHHLALLVEAGLLTRDARVKERKKAGLKKARKAPQYSKR